MFPVFLCLLIVLLQLVINSELDNPRYRCGCKCIPTNDSTCKMVCGLEYSTYKQASACPIPQPEKWPALLQVPDSSYRAVQTDAHSFRGLWDNSCLKTHSCPVTSIFTAQNRSVAESLVKRVEQDAFPEESTNALDLASLSYIGTSSKPGTTNFVERAFLGNSSINIILPHCPGNFSYTIPMTVGSATFHHDIDCVESLYLWRKNSSIINRELFQGYRGGNSAKEIHEILGAYDFLNTSKVNYNVRFWYNSTYNNLVTVPRLLRIHRALNMISNAFLRNFRDDQLHVFLEFVKEMPKPGTRMRLDLSSALSPLLFAWVIQLLFPVFLTSLVYEKQHKLTIMMKLHGLRDGPYWLITYGYFLVISFIYMTWFAIIGSIAGLEIFRLNSFSIQFVFYLLYLKLQIVLAFLAAAFFSEAETARVAGYIYVFGSGLLGAFLFNFYIEDTTFSRWWLMFMELMPGFSLYRGLYELSQSALAGHNLGTFGMKWEDLSDQKDGIRGTLIIMALEWLILLAVSYYMNQVISSGNGITRHPLFFLGTFWKRDKQLPTFPSFRERSTIFVDLESPDISEERYKVQQLMKEPNGSYPIFCHNLKKVYIGQDGNSRRHAVQSLSLAVPQGECFGMLGPSGSGKTTFINMVTGFLPPTSGTAFIDYMDIVSNMDHIYTRISICPQQDLLWETLTGREHLLFYGRLRNLKGKALHQVVDKSLRSLNLCEGNLGDQLVGRYSGGMKRRLSLAISLISYTRVVFLDEPTTGLDPESRNYVWNVIKQAKAARAIILTTHSMEEAEFLCDRIGIIVNGNLQCLGSSRELKSRYGGSYVLTISVDPIYEKNVDSMVNSLSPNAIKIYNIGGTQKFRLPKQDVRISQVFQAIQNLKREVALHAFGFSDVSLEDVFLNVVHEASQGQRISTT
ncbi:PREDICTED: ABC transporter A family member 7-like isoform X2 [Nelumbo nucifera]|nr:PREDICTED: ABC transporter A family member 7-like isoform X2 [Nelumbo nucifera]